MGELPASSQLRMSLSGPLSIVGSNGDDVALSSPMSKRLIAILLRSDGMRKSRAVLQMMLWKDSSQDVGANLRQLVLQTRLRLKKYGPHLIANAGYVGLVNTNDLTYKKQNQQTEFFEDAGFGNEEFEDWLRTERSWYFELPTHIPVPTVELHKPRKPRVGLFNPAPPRSGSRASVVTEWVSNLFRDVFTWSDFIEFYDLRHQTGPKCDVDIEISVTPLGTSFELSSAARIDGQCQWSQSMLVPSGPNMSDFRGSVQEFAQSSVCAVENCIAKLLSYSEKNWGEAPFYEVVSRLFEMSPASVSGANSALKDLHLEQNDTSMLAWRGFAKMLQNGERLVDNRGGLISDADTLIQKALEAGPSNPTALVIAAHYHAYITRDYQRAFELSDDALQLAPFSPFVRDVRATLELYVGNLEKASFHSDIAYRIGRFGPMRHYLAATRVMLDTLNGNHQRAMSSAKSLLISRPNFLPVMRYSAASMAALGFDQQAREVISNIQKTDPEYGTRAMLEPSYPLPSSKGRTTIFTLLTDKNLTN